MGPGTLVPMPSIPPKMSMGAKNMKIAPGALGTNKNETGSVKLALTPTVPPKIDFGSAKHQNGTRRHRYLFTPENSGNWKGNLGQKIKKFKEKF
jgi:hypothetical protein